MIYLIGIAIAFVLTAGVIIGRRQMRIPTRRSTDSQASDVTIVFTNIIDFVGLFEREGDIRAVEIVNLYRETMTPIIRRYNGYLNKFIGDKMFIIFNTPVNPDKNHCALAIQMVLAMQDSLSDLDAKLEKSGHRKIQMSIGVATGIAVVGDTGPAAASDYTALGSVVNIAAGLEQACKKTGRENLVSVETIAQLGNQFEYDAVALGANAITPALAYEVTTKKEFLQ